MQSNNVLPDTCKDTATAEPSPTPATDKPQDSPPSEAPFTHADWKRKVLENMNRLDQNPDEALALRKRGF